MRVTLRVNGRMHDVDVEPERQPAVGAALTSSG